ncbi:MAG TPA: hypothetical protein VHH34_10780, partial [Pseudonocardiaceae bacterium]|nr:hypothetical protein [Pseudonocardiaceae bacterium]
SDAPGADEERSRRAGREEPPPFAFDDRPIRADQADIAVLDDILARRRTMSCANDHAGRNRVALHVVGDPSP